MKNDARLRGKACEVISPPALRKPAQKIIAGFFVTSFPCDGQLSHGSGRDLQLSDFQDVFYVMQVKDIMHKLRGRKQKLYIPPCEASPSKPACFFLGGDVLEAKVKRNCVPP